MTIKDVLEKPFNCCRSKSWERRKEEDHRERRDEMNMTQVEMMMTISVMRMMIDHDDD